MLFTKKYLIAGLYDYATFRVYEDAQTCIFPLAFNE